MLYIIQTVIYTSVLYTLYLLFLKNKPLHRFNRWYLLAIAALGFLLPVVKFSFLSDSESLISLYGNIRMPEIVVTGTGATDRTVPLSSYFLPGYVVITMLLLGIVIARRVQLYHVIKRSEKIISEHYTLLINTAYGPGSHGKYIFLPEAEADPRIIEHEAAHIRLRHTLDNDFMVLLQCLFWYHPVLFFIRKELQQVHEFEADAEVQTDRSDYQHLLLNHLLKRCQLPFTHSFIHHPIKRRIMMLNKKINRKNRIVRIAVTVVAVLFLSGNIVWFQSCKAKEWEMKNETGAPLTPKENSGKDGEEVYNHVEKMPEPSVNLAEFLAQNIQYPKEAKRKGIEGKVIVKFIVDKTGKVVDARVVKSPNELLSAEALRVINSMPTWKPGENEQGEKVAVYFSQPINFKLDKKRKKEATTSFNVKETHATQEVSTSEEEAKRILERLANPFQTPNPGC